MHTYILKFNYLPDFYRHLGSRYTVIQSQSGTLNNPNYPFVVNACRGDMSRPVSHKHVANAEILSVTSAMRKNSRWAVATHRALYVGDSALARDLGLRKSGPLNPSAIARSGTREADLMVGFLELKSALREVEGDT